MSLLAMAALVCLPGLALLGAAARRPLGLLAWLALPPTLGILLAGSVGALLASAGRLTPGALALAVAALTAPLALFAIRHRPLAAHARRIRLDARRNAREHGTLALLVLVALAAYERPSEWVIADGTDAGNYLVQAAHEARTGSVFMDDAPSETMRARFPRAVHAWSSAVGVPAGGGRRELPFPPLFKTVLALAILGGGVTAALHAPLLLGILACLVAHVALRRLARTPGHALAGTALLLLSPLLLKSLRVTLAEVCLLLVAVSGLALLEHAARAGGRALAVLAGLVLSLALLTRVDGLLLYAGGVLMIAAGAVPRGPGRRDLAPFFAPALLCGSALSWLVSAHATHAYLDAQLRGHSRAVGWALALAPAAWAACRRLPRLPPRAGRLLALSALGLFAVQACATLLVRPALACLRGPEAFASLRSDGGPGVVVVAYATAVTTLLGVLGTVLALAERASRFRAWVLLFLVAAVVYLNDLHHSPAPFWSSRRLLASALPLFVAGAVRALELRPFVTPRATLRPAVACALLANLAVHDARLTVGRGIFYVGADRSLAELAGAFGPTDLIVVDGAHPWAAPLQLGLRYVHGLDACAPYLDSLDDEDLRALHEGAVRDARRIAFVAAGPAAEARLRRLFALREQPQVLRFRHLTGGAGETSDVDLRWLFPAPGIRAHARAR
ncbi:MAG: hypothetical protein ABW221_02505 [Vicinamibacteria bacterium]